MHGNREYRIGDSYVLEKKVTSQMIIDFASNTGDMNPIHIDEQYASESRFQQRVAQGFLIGSFISSVLGNYFPGNGTIYLSQTMKFLAPVFINDVIKVHVEVVDIPKPNRLELNTLCINQNDQIVISGQALVIPPIN